MTNSLPPQGPHEPDDLLPGEAELRSLYGKLPQTEPGPALDAAVMRAAAEAVLSPTANVPAGKPPAKIRNQPPRWFIGLGSAATLVLAAGLAWHMRSLPQADSLPAATETVSSKAPDTSAMNTSAADAPRASISTAMLAPAAIPPPPSTPSKQPPPPHIIHAARLQQSKAVAEQARIQTTRKKVEAAMAATPSAETRSALGEVPPARVPSARQNRSAADKVVAPPQRIQPQIIMAAPSPPLDATPERQAPAPSAPPAPPAPVQTASTAMQVDDSRGQEIPVAQLAELEAIRQLFADHRDEQAQQRLETFHRLHPQWQLPVDLQVRLRKP